MRLRQHHFALIIVVFAGPAGAEEAPHWPVERGPAPIPAPFAYRADALRDAPPEYLRDAPACFVYSGTTHTLEADGTLSTTTMEVVRLNSRRGIDQQGQYRSITFNPAYEKVMLHTARVHKASGAADDIEPRHLFVRDVNTDHQVYDSNKQVIISFPRLEIGDVLEVYWTVRGRHPEYQDQFFYRYSFGDEKYPTLRDEWTVRLPRERELRFETINGAVPVAISDEGGLRVYSWKTTNRAAPPAGERQPPADEQKLQVACSTFASWQAVHDWEKKLLAGRCDCPGDGKTLVAELTRDLPTPEAKARAITHWVRNHVRYLSRGEKHDYTPHSPARVLKDRCGDCKDAAHLLAVLLREAGLKAGVATLGPRGDGQVLENLPCPWGTHALVVVPIDGREHWIDTTAIRIGWDILPRDDRNRGCFITDPDGIRVGRTPGTSPDDQRTESTTTLTVASNGDAVGERETRYSGIAAWLKREEYADVPSADRRLAIAGDLQEAFPRAKITKLTFDALDDPDASLIVRCEFTAPEAFAGEGPLEARLGDFAFWTAMLGASANPERTAPLDIGDPCEFVSRFVVQLPPVYRLAATPESQSASSRWGALEVKIEHAADQPRRLTIASRGVLSDGRVMPADFPLWRDYQELVQSSFRVAVAIKPTRESADIAALEAVCAKSPDDIRTMTTLASLYVDQKKHDQAKEILEKACAAAPQDRKLWDLSLSAAESIEDQERLYRLMIARFPGEPKLSIELAQNLLDQERPTDAQEVLEPLVQHPDSHIQCSALIELAHASMAQDEPKKALRHLQAAEKVRADSFTSDTWFLKGQIHEAIREPQAAIDAYRKALNDEEAPDVLEALVRLSIASDSRVEALDYFRRLAVAVGENPEGMAQAAELAARLGRFDDAADLANRARVSKTELHPLAHKPLGLAMFHQSKFTEAVEQLRRAPVDAEALTALVQALVALGRLSDAEAQAERIASVEPTAESRRAVAWIKALSARRIALSPIISAASTDSANQQIAIERAICAEALFLRGLWPDQVDRLLSEAIINKTPIGLPWGLRAQLRVKRGQFAAALRDAELAISLSPNEPNGYHARGRVRAERAQPGALDDLERAAKLSERRDAVILNDLATAYFSAGRKTEAVAAQREAAKLKPDDGEIRDQLREFENAK
jgi:tetratricopeptide (TPR) repeat protein/transglutaminase-like putative cysteine protease